MEELRQWFEILSAVGTDPAGGFYRGSYTPQEQELCRLIGGWMKEAGLSVRRDAAGNLWGRAEGSGQGKEELPVVTGSHMDSVRGGGNYDGIYGVLGGLTAVKELLAEHGAPRRPVEVVSFTGEEGSRFSIGLMGSHAATGTLKKEDLYEKTDPAGISVAEGLREVGLDPERLEEAAHGPVGAYLEMHIEQGPVLEQKKIPIGIVDSIVGTQQFRVTMYGEAGHAGTVPMNARRDPMVYAARAIARFPAVAANSGDGVITVGRIWARPDAENVIPGEVSFTVDLRHPCEEIKQEMIRTVRAICEEEAAPGGRPVGWTAFPDNPATAMDPELKKRLSDACGALGLPCLAMPSGAGHDAMNMAFLGPVGMLFIPCRGGRSHCPQEYASFEDMRRGVDVLKETLYHLAWEP